jgi:hypothetical protein
MKPTPARVKRNDAPVTQPVNPIWFVCGCARGKADVLYVADAFAVMAKVNELLAARK